MKMNISEAVLVLFSSWILDESQLVGFSRSDSFVWTAQVVNLVAAVRVYDCEQRELQEPAVTTVTAGRLKLI